MLKSSIFWRFSKKVQHVNRKDPVKLVPLVPRNQLIFKALVLAQEVGGIDKQLRLTLTSKKARAVRSSASSPGSQEESCLYTCLWWSSWWKCWWTWWLTWWQRWWPFQCHPPPGHPGWETQGNPSLAAWEPFSTLFSLSLASRLKSRK